jgi:hypothetical protein
MSVVLTTRRAVSFDPSTSPWVVSMRGGALKHLSNVVTIAAQHGLQPTAAGAVIEAAAAEAER